MYTEAVIITLNVFKYLISFYFCVGKYCVYKVSESCPAGFKQGSLYWDDDVDIQYSILEHPVQSTTGKFSNIIRLR